MFSAINITASGMTANKEFIEVTSNNIANMNTTRTSEGTPYKRQGVVMESIKNFDNYMDSQTGNGGVKVTQITEDPGTTLSYDPNHPDANEEGYVSFPAINLAAEITNLMQAQRSYEANATALNSIKQSMQKELEIGKL